MNKNLEWFWAHRRNSSLHHMSFLMRGLAGKGWAPAVDFWFDNQAFVGVPGKGIYIFYDKHQLSSEGKYKDVQESIDKNPDFVGDFKKRTDELFGAIFASCKQIDAADLVAFTDTELEALYVEILSSLMIAPIISVQLWGIEACFDESYRIIRFLRSRLEELHKSRDFDTYRGLLSVNTGETVAFTEQKDFYGVAAQIARVPELAILFAGENTASASTALKRFPKEDALFTGHVSKYEWMHSEYVGHAWSREKWIALFQKAFRETLRPEEKLKELLENFAEQNAERNNAIAELSPPPDVLHAIDALGEFIAQRDWTKGYFTKILLSYHKLLDEIGRRHGLARTELFDYSYIEVQELLASGNRLSNEELKSRKQDGFAVVITGGDFNLTTGKDAIASVINTEGLAEPFEKYMNVSEFKGLAASRGHITGKARVLEDASRISELQPGEILVTYMTTIEFIPAFRKAAAVVTDEGGMSCHAAIISREFKLPCVVGTKVATRVVQTGDTLEVDAIHGIIKILDSATPSDAV